MDVVVLAVDVERFGLDVGARCCVRILTSGFDRLFGCSSVATSGSVPKQRGSNNRKKAVAKVARTHARVADTRRDWQHKLSTSIIRDNQAVYVEDLCVVGFGRTRLAKSVHDAGWASFTGMLEYKAALHGRTFARVDRFFPSTRLCSSCGQVSDKPALNVRSWDRLCGSTHDRDINAAKNVLAAEQADNSNDRGARVRPAAVPAPRDEAVTHPDVARSTRGVEGVSVR